MQPQPRRWMTDRHLADREQRSPARVGTSRRRSGAAARERRRSERPSDAADWSADCGRRCRPRAGSSTRRRRAAAAPPRSRCGCRGRAPTPARSPAIETAGRRAMTKRAWWSARPARASVALPVAARTSPASTIVASRMSTQWLGNASEAWSIGWRYGTLAGARSHDRTGAGALFPHQRHAPHARTVPHSFAPGAPDRRLRDRERDPRSPVAHRRRHGVVARAAQGDHAAGRDRGAGAHPRGRPRPRSRGRGRRVVRQRAAGGVAGRRRHQLQLGGGPRSQRPSFRRSAGAVRRARPRGARRRAHRHVGDPGDARRRADHEHAPGGLPPVPPGVRADRGDPLRARSSSPPATSSTRRTRSRRSRPPSTPRAAPACASRSISPIAS